MTSPLGVELSIGQKWLDPRNREVEIIDVTSIPKLVRLQGNARRTWAQLERFNGKQSGYRPSVNLKK